MNDEQLLREVGSWLMDTDPEPPDAHARVRQALAPTPGMRQRGRRWPLPILRRADGPPAVEQTTVLQPDHISATNGHTPTTITGRTRTMFSPAKAIAAGALIFGIGSALLLAQPFQQASSAPGAATDDPATAPSFFSGTTGDDWVQVEGTSTRRTTGVVDNAGERYTVSWDTNDPRISGTASMLLSDTDYRQGALTLAPTGDSGTMRSVLLRIVNDDGSWQGPLYYLIFDDPETANAAGWLTGAGAYEGLSAYLFWPDPEGGTIRGHITAEGPPLLPESLPE